MLKAKKRQLTLNKGDEKFIFRYQEGMEFELMIAIMEAAEDKRTNFNWDDAAILSFKIIPSVLSEAGELVLEPIEYWL